MQPALAREVEGWVEVSLGSNEVGRLSEMYRLRRRGRRARWSRIGNPF